MLNNSIFFHICGYLSFPILKIVYFDFLFYLIKAGQKVFFFIHNLKSQFLVLYLVSPHGDFFQFHRFQLLSILIPFPLSFKPTSGSPLKETVFPIHDP